MTFKYEIYELQNVLNIATGSSSDSAAIQSCVLISAIAISERLEAIPKELEKQKRD